MSSLNVTAVKPTEPAFISVHLNTHHPWARIGHSALIGHPLVVGSFLVGKGSQERSADVIHCVDTDCSTTKHRTKGENAGYNSESVKDK